MKKLPEDMRALSTSHLKDHLTTLKTQSQRLHSLASLISRELKQRNRTTAI